MTRSLVALLLLLSVTLIGGAILAAESPEQVTLRDARGMVVGTATLKAHGASGVAFELALKGLPPGEHAVHLHETPTCDAPSFESAGPHLNPAGKQHGLHNPSGPHAGDMNNVVVAANGSVKTTLVNTRVTVGPGADSLRFSRRCGHRNPRPTRRHEERSGRERRRPHRVRCDPGSLA